MKNYPIPTTLFLTNPNFCLASSSFFQLVARRPATVPAGRRSDSGRLNAIMNAIFNDFHCLTVPLAEFIVTDEVLAKVGHMNHSHDADPFYSLIYLSIIFGWSLVMLGPTAVRKTRIFILFSMFF